ncbi:MAG TPA: zinc-binding dehydrogenase [Streptosporangiaceae bacterium]
MKAGRWVDMGRVVCEEVPRPSPADGEILVRTAYTSICGSDLHSVYGGPPPPGAPAGWPGHESVGEVVDSRCPGFEPGDRVLTVPHFVDGRCMAEYQALPGSFCIRLDGKAPLSHLLMAQQLGTVIYALRRHQLDLIGQDVAVIGQGSAGAFFTYLLKRAGARSVLVTDKSPARLAYSRQLGADLTVLAGGSDADGADVIGAGAAGPGATGEAFRAAVLEATGGRGAGLVVEAVGSRETFPLSVELAADSATVLWFGLPEGVDTYPFFFPEFFVRRLTAYAISGTQGEPGLESFRYAVQLIADGALDVAPLLSHMLPIDRVEEAFHMAHDRTDGALKVSIEY